MKALRSERTPHSLHQSDDKHHEPVTQSHLRALMKSEDSDRHGACRGGSVGPEEKVVPQVDR